MLKGVCDPRTSANVLLAGKRGSGKSTALASIAGMLAADPNHVYARFVNCNRMVGELLCFIEPDYAIPGYTYYIITLFTKKSIFMTKLWLNHHASRPSHLRQTPRICVQRAT